MSIETPWWGDCPLGIALAAGFAVSAAGCERAGEPAWRGVLDVLRLGILISAARRLGGSAARRLGLVADQLRIHPLGPILPG